MAGPKAYCTLGLAEDEAAEIRKVTNSLLKEFYRGYVTAMREQQIKDQK